MLVVEEVQVQEEAQVQDLQHWQDQTLQALAAAAATVGLPHQQPWSSLS